VIEASSFTLLVLLDNRFMMGAPITQFINHVNLAFEINQRRDMDSATVGLRCGDKSLLN